MNQLAVKLNYKADWDALIVNPPEGLMDWSSVFGRFRIAWYAGNENQTHELPDAVDFALVFAFEREALRNAMDNLAPRLSGDVVLWMCYPKKSSRRYQSDLDRDHGWAVLGELGFEPVRQVALDEDFSALRFRRVEYIKKMVRKESMRLTK